MTSKLLRQFDRPDGGQTPAEGGMEVLSFRKAEDEADIMSSAVLVNWAFEGYMSEFNAHHDLVLEARFVSVRWTVFSIHLLYFGNAHYLVS